YDEKDAPTYSRDHDRSPWFGRNILCRQSGGRGIQPTAQLCALHGSRGRATAYRRENHNLSDLDEEGDSRMGDYDADRHRTSSHVHWCCTASSIRYIQLHSAKGLGAGVDVPRHVDVYARSSDGTLSLVGSLAAYSRKWSDKRDHWLAVDLQVATEALVVVLHASGDYLFLDEIEWRPSGMGRFPTIPSGVANVRTALEESTRRVSRSIERAAAVEAEGAALSVPTNSLHVWSQDPWED